MKKQKQTNEQKQNKKKEAKTKISEERKEEERQWVITKQTTKINKQTDTQTNEQQQNIEINKK